MGNAYNNASLLVTPNGYKASKIYSAKPTDGTGDLAFSRASTAMRRNSAGLWESVANNVPRLQYPVGGGCPSWLFEPQATNLILSSEALSATYIVTDGTSTITANAALSPRGTTTAASFMEAATTTGHYLYQFAAVAIGLKYTISARIKPNGRNFVGISFPAVNGAFVAGRVWFNLTGLGSVGTKEASIDSASIAVDSEGYYFIQATATATATVSAIPSLFIADADNSFSYLGDITKGLYVWNFQFEAGSVATSPIITAGSAVTRLADTCQKANFGNTSTAGTLYYEFLNYNSPAAANGEYMVALFVGSTIGDAFYNTANSISIINNGTQVQGVNNVYLTNLFSIAPAAGATVKIALRYDGTNVVAFVNGVKGTVFADTSVGVKNAIRVNNGENATHSTKELLFIPAAISDAEAIELTTL
jgi:hypothetical protein